MGYNKIAKLFLAVIILTLFIIPFSARAEYCFWSPTMNNSPKPGEDTCNKPGETTFIMDSTTSSCQGQPKNPTFDKICCCQITDKPGQCTVNANACAAGENCVNGWCEGKKVTLINPLTQLQVLIPGLDKIAQEFPASCTTTDAKTNCTLPWIAIYIKALYNYALGIIGILAAIALMVGGIIWLVSSGNATRISQAQSWIVGSLTGLLIMVTSYILLNQINPDLIGLKPVMIKIIDAYEIPKEDQSIDAPTSLGSNHGVPWLLQCSPQGKAVAYGNCNDGSTVCSSGCGLMSTLMVLNKYGQTPTLSEWEQKVVANGGRVCGNGSNSAGLIKAAGEYGLKGQQLNGIDDISKKLDSGYPVIISLRGPCTYTNNGHFIVLTGWREKDKLIADVNDPNNPKSKDEKTWISLKTLAGCTLNQMFYLYQ